MSLKLFNRRSPDLRNPVVRARAAMGPSDASQAASSHFSQISTAVRVQDAAVRVPLYSYSSTRTASTRSCIAAVK